MKRLLAYLFLVLGLGLVFSVNTNADASFKSALDIDKKEKIRFVNNNPYFWGYIFLQEKIKLSILLGVLLILLGVFISQKKDKKSLMSKVT